MEQNKRCLFCKKISSSSVSIEHIIPESLGNTKHVLPPGIVCDKCNNYFARKVEKPFLESSSVKSLRFDQGIESKRGRIPPVEGILHPGFKATIQKFNNSPYLGYIHFDDPGAFEHIMETDKGTILLPYTGNPPEDRIVSRFLSKIAIEAFAYRLIAYQISVDSILDDEQFDPIRRYAREGYPQEWPFFYRRIYETNQHFQNETGEEVQTLNEFDFLMTEEHELFFIVAIFGLELTINMGGPEINGYKKWLNANDDLSPLYHGKNVEDPRTPS